METLFDRYLKSVRNQWRATNSGIHPSALIDPAAKIGKNVSVGPFSIIGKDVVLEDGVQIGSHVIIEGKTLVGKDTQVWPFASLGLAPQDLKFQAEPGELIIGPSNVIREYCNFSIGTSGGGGHTVLGAKNLFMVRTHIGHDSVVGSSCIFANSVSLAGHVKVADQVILAGHCAVHQFCSVGKLALCAGGAMVTQDVPPFTMVHGNRAKENGLNLVGLKRAGYSAEAITQIKLMHRLIYRESFTVDDAIRRIMHDVPDSAYRQEFIAFIQASERGICR